MDMHLVYTGADLPVGGRLSHYYENWCQVFRDPWVLEKVQGHRLELHLQPPKNLPILPFVQQQNGGLTRAVRELVDKRVIQPVWNWRGFFSHKILYGSQERGLISSSDQSKVPEYLPCLSPFQDQSSEEPDPEGQLDWEARPQRCLPVCPNLFNTQEIPLPMGGASM